MYSDFNAGPFYFIKKHNDHDLNELSASTSQVGLKNTDNNTDGKIEKTCSRSLKDLCFFLFHIIWCDHLSVIPLAHTFRLNSPVKEI